MSNANHESPLITARKPMLVRLEKAGKRVFWCSCGRSQTQPFCDGSHEGTSFRPVPYVTRADGEEVLFCLCKNTGNAPFCDGSHNRLADRYEEAGEDEIAASASTPVAPPDKYGLARVNGGALVLTPKPETAALRKGWRILPVIGAATGAGKLSLFLVETGRDAAPLSFPNSEAVIFVLKGEGEIAIAGRRFAASPEFAFAVRPGESIAFAPGDGNLRAAITVSPQPDKMDFGGPGATFDETVPNRMGRVDAAKRNTMGDRFYQVLADPSTGARDTTQFLGEIPRSRAAAHRHLYEEAIVILSGKGYLWTENMRAAVNPGDIVFLPARQLHSLECTSETGMRLAGSFYPSGSPAINY